jgi:aminoglycoside phosphotransferase
LNQHPVSERCRLPRVMRHPYSAMRFDPTPPVKPAFSSNTIRPVLQAVNAQSGGGYRVVRKFTGGVWGAWLVRDRLGHDAVLKCIWDVDWRTRLSMAAAVVDEFRDRGGPAPRYLHYGYIDGMGTWSLQERLPGRSVKQLTGHLLGQVLHMNELQARAGRPPSSGFNWTEHVRREVLSDASGMETALRSHSRSTARVASVIREKVFSDSDVRMCRRDLVHGDLLATQILVAGGRMSGVLDWDVAAYGDRCIDLALLFMNVHVQADRIRQPLDQEMVLSLGSAAVTEFGHTHFGLCLAYHLMRMMGFVVRNAPDRVPWRTSLALRTIQSFERLRGD